MKIFISSVQKSETVGKTVGEKFLITASRKELIQLLVERLGCKLAESQIKITLIINEKSKC
jgi:hypothetical protein